MAQGKVYERCAVALEKSIHRVMPDANVEIITTAKLPYGDQALNSDWKLINDWQVYDASPFEYTIKLEADMFIPRSIEHWWEILRNRDVVVSTHIRDFKQQISGCRVYRNFIDDNKLPDCYNAITYFKKSEFAETFYKTVRHIFENWNEFRSTLRCNVDEPATTDWVYAIACHVLGVEKTTLPQFSEFGMIHMKQFVNNLPSENWTDTLIYELLPHAFRINSVPQHYPFHYHVKSFADQIMEKI